jgi:hypothetical protein
MTRLAKGNFDLENPVAPQGEIAQQMEDMEQRGIAVIV